MIVQHERFTVTQLPWLHHCDQSLNRPYKSSSRSRLQLLRLFLEVCWPKSIDI